MDPFYPAVLEHCRLCPRLAEHREAVAEGRVMRRRSHAGEPYWGKPVPGFGDPEARLLLLGLAPGAHGSNRTGRMFTGDASGDFLYPALYRAGLANQPASTARGDGLALTGVWITAACRCVPPQNKPTRKEVATCRRWLEHDLTLLPGLKLVLALGAIAHNAYLELLKARGETLVKRDYPFAHGALHHPPGGLSLLDSYHVSFQNTNTGKLTPAMFDALLARAKGLAGLP
jgi:uracil-DNA glycosylase family 4